MMQAPCSLNALAFGTMRRAGFDPVWAEMVTHILVFFSTFVLWLTFVALWQRRHVIHRYVGASKIENNYVSCFFRRGFALDWVALTFPSSSSVVAILQYTDPALNENVYRTTAPIYRAVLQSYSYFLAVLTILGIVYVAGRLACCFFIMIFKDIRGYFSQSAKRKISTELTPSTASISSKATTGSQPSDFHTCEIQLMSQ